MSTVCRICLAANMRLYDVKNNLLLRLYENLTDSKFNSEDARRRALCTFCYQKLLRCYTFSQMAIRSEKFLSHLTYEDLEVTQEYITQVNLNMKQHLSMTNMQFIVIGHDTTNAGSKIIVKDEPLPITDIKEEVTTEPDTLLVEDNTNNQLTLEEDNDLGNDVEELLFNKSQTKSNVSKISFECNSCSKIFDLKRKLISHIRNSHYEATGAQHSSTRKQTETSCMTKVKKIQNKNKKLTCHECGKSFDRKSGLIQHLRTHTGEEPFACNVCHKQFNQKTTLVQHMKTHTAEKPFTCNVCEKQFNRKDHLAVHMRTHTGEKPFACNVCDKQFKLKTYLITHTRIHTGEKPFACNVCSKQFHQKSNLVRHMTTHTGEKRFACNVCDKSFIKKQFYQKCKLVQHMRIHTGEKPFACNVCDKQFYQKHHLADHMRTHTGEKPFACNICDKKFNHKSTLVHHMRTHTGEKPFACNVCYKQFHQKSTLVQHMRTHTGEKPAIYVINHLIINVV